LAPALCVEAGFSESAQNSFTMGKSECRNGRERSEIISNAPHQAKTPAHYAISFVENLQVWEYYIGKMIILMS
jgi:hypothetical protein